MAQRSQFHDLTDVDLDWLFPGRRSSTAVLDEDDFDLTGIIKTPRQQQPAQRSQPVEHEEPEWEEPEARRAPSGPARSKRARRPLYAQSRAWCTEDLTPPGAAAAFFDTEGIIKQFQPVSYKEAKEKYKEQTGRAWPAGSADPFASAPPGAKDTAPTPPPTPFGLRPDGTPKGDGFLGILKRPDGDVSTEISIGVEFDGKQHEIPTIVPTLSASELRTLLTLGKDQPIPKPIVDKAVAHARQRLDNGLSPFAGPGERPRHEILQQFPRTGPPRPEPAEAPPALPEPPAPTKPGWQGPPERPMASHAPPMPP